MTIKDADEFAYKLARGFAIIERRHRSFINRALKEAGISGVVYTYVIIIKKNPGVSQDSLAESQGVDKSRVARIVRDLELGGYITREPSPGNRRQYRLSLTASGEELYAMIMKKSVEWGVSISQGIDEKDKESITRTIDKIIDNMSHY